MNAQIENQIELPQLEFTTNKLYKTYKMFSSSNKQEGEMVEQQIVAISWGGNCYEEIAVKKETDEEQSETSSKSGKESLSDRAKKAMGFLKKPMQDKEEDNRRTTYLANGHWEDEIDF